MVERALDGPALERLGAALAAAQSA